MWRKVLATSRGDTIVEVLVIIGVIALILTGAYVTTNNNLHTSRDSQERINALKLAEAQVERLRSASQTKEFDVFNGSPSTFCIAAGPSKRATSLLYKDADPGCLLNAGGGTAAAGQQPAFAMTITGPDSAGIFTIRSKWISSSGRDDGNDNNDSDRSVVELKYRVHR